MHTPRQKRRMRSPFKQLYDEVGIVPSIRRSLCLMLCSCACGNVFGIITSGAVFTGFAQQLGANDLMFGILMAVPFIGTFMQLPTSILVSKFGHRKKAVIVFGGLSRALWILIGLVPLYVPISPIALRIWVIIFLKAISAMSSSVVAVSFTPWMAEFVPVSIQGRWLSLRNKIESIISVTVGLVISYLIDSIHGYMGYMLVIELGGLIGIIDICFYIGVIDVPVQIEKNIKWVDTYKQVLTNKPFIYITVFWTALNFSTQLAEPYLIRYALGPMQLSFFQTTLCFQIVTALVSLLFVGKWGRMLDHYGTKPTLIITQIGSSLCMSLWLFARQGGMVIVLIYCAISSSFKCANMLLSVSMLINFSNREQRSSYIAVQACFTQLLGNFLGVLVGGVLLEWFHSIILNFGLSLDYYKVLFALSMCLQLLVQVSFLPKIGNEKPYHVKDLLLDARKTF